MQIPMPILEAQMRSPGLGFEQVDTLHECTYRDSSTVMVCPTRGQIDYRVVQSWSDLIRVPNQRRSFLFCEGAEVADAYNKLVDRVLSDFQLSTCRYLMTVEDDNILPADAHLRLLDTIQSGPWDAVSGIYFKKTEPAHPLVFGDPEKRTALGGYDFRVRDVREALASGETVEVNGIPMGCAIFKMDLFREIPGPWFRTVNEYVMTPAGPIGRRQSTHDLDFCERARFAGKRFAVDCGVKVGHLDVATGVIY